MVKRISTNWKTTLIGFIIIIAAIVSVFKGITWTEASVAIMIGIALLLSKDPRTFKNIPAIIGAMFLISSCSVKYSDCLEKFGTGKTDTVKVPFMLKVPGATFESVVPKFVPYAVPGEVQYITDQATGAKIKYWKDKSDSLLRIQAICPDAEVKGAVQCPPANIFKPKDEPGWLKRSWVGYCQFTGLFSIVVLASCIIFFILKKLPI